MLNAEDGTVALEMGDGASPQQTRGVFTGCDVGCHEGLAGGDASTADGY